MTTKRKRGRPNRAEASRRALSLLLEAGIDPDTINPRAILAAIAADSSAPASARVSACRALIACALPVPIEPEPRPTRNGKAAAGELSKRALTLLGGRAN
jgi:hypothetical protein